MIVKKKGYQLRVNLVMALLALACIFPFLLLVASSFTDENALITGGYALIPKAFSLASYEYLLTSAAKIVRGYGITILITVVGTTISILLTVLMGYPLSRRELPGRNGIAFFIFFTMLFNGGLVPSYMMWTQIFHIKNTIFALIIPGLLLSAFYVIMMRTYFTSNIPDALIEAARIDGAGEFRIVARIIFPLSKPMVASLALLVGLNYWNNWTNGLYYITDTKLFSIQNILNRMLMDAQFIASGAGGSNLAEASAAMPTTGIKMAVAVIGILPILVIYPFMQKYLVKGISIGAVKG